MLGKSVCAVLLLLFGAITLSAQSDIPIISGGIQYLNSTQGGATTFQPTIAPVVSIPIGQHWLTSWTPSSQ